VPIFGKYNYIFFAKLSESLLLEHKFLLDNDKKDLLGGIKRQVQCLQKRFNINVNDEKLLKELERKKLELKEEEQKLKDKINKTKEITT